jgi:4-hydroxybenzoate polyprenyltransferase
VKATGQLPRAHPLAAFVVTLRPWLMFVSGSAGAVGLALADVPPRSAAVAFAALFVSYGFGQALTDVSQTDTDALSAPERPLVRGEIAPAAVLAGSLAGLGLCALLLAALSPWTLAPSLAAAGFVATYTPMKRRWWAGPPWNSAAVALLPAAGALAGGAVPRDVLGGSALLAMTSVFATYAVFVVLGYLKDVEADRATGYDTLPVRFGRRPAIVASAAVCAVGLVASALLVPHTPTPGALLWLTGAGLLVGAHVVAWNVHADADAWRAVAPSVTGFVALHLGEAALFQPRWTAAAVVLLLGSIAALRFRPSRRQV